MGVSLIAVQLARATPPAAGQPPTGVGRRARQLASVHWAQSSTTKLPTSCGAVAQRSQQAHVQTCCWPPAGARAR